MSKNSSPVIVVQDSSAKMSAKETFFKYLVYLPLFILSIATCVTIAYLYIRYKVPIYSSGISLLVKDAGGRTPSGNGDEVLLDEMMLYKKRSNLANEMEVLKSVNMMERVVRSLGLNLIYHSEGKVKRTELYGGQLRAEVSMIKDSSASFGVMIEKQKNALLVSYEGKKRLIKSGEELLLSNGKMKIIANPDELAEEYKYYVTWLPVHVAASSLGVRASQLSREASIIRLTIDTEVPQKGVDILNQLVVEYREMNIEDKNRVVDNTIRFIDERLNLITAQLGQVEGGKQSFLQKNNLVDIQGQSAKEVAEIGDITKKIDEQEVQLSLIDMVRDYTSNPAKKFDLVPSSLGITDATLQTLIAAYNELQLKREAELKSIPAAHPSIKLIDSQIEKVRISILENLANIRKTVVTLAGRYKAEYRQLQGRLREVPEQQREYTEILRQAGIKEKLYLFLLQKREESAITRASAVGNAAAIDSAFPGGMVSPNTTGIYRIAFIIGLLFPLGLIYIRDLLNDKVITRLDITRMTDTPLIGEVAHHSSMARQFVVSIKDRNILAEQFRILRTNLQFLLAHAPAKNPVILVTSSIAGEGKTFTSMNMAAVWAVAGKKTVILELDLRKPKISKALKLQRDVGITNYILGTAKKEDLPQLSGEVPNLYIIGAGPIPPNPSEMIMDNKMDELFTYLRANFDIIIIDSAPVGLVSDSKILSRYADATLYLVRQRYTVKKQIAFIDDLYKQKVLPNMGLVVNDVKIGGANSYYGYGYGYGYGYSYNYNYSYSYGEKEKRTLVQKVRDFVGL